MSRTSSYRPSTPAAHHRRRIGVPAYVPAIAVAVALAAWLTPASVDRSAPAQRVNPAAHHATTISSSPNVVVFSVPAQSPAKKHKKHKKRHHNSVPDNSGDSESSHSHSSGSSGDSQSSDSSGQSTDSGSSGSPDAPTSNTVGDTETGGASTDNNHTDPSGDSDSTSRTGSSSSSRPAQLNDNTGAGGSGLEPTDGDSSGSAGRDSTAAPIAAAAMTFVWVQCPASVAAGTICLQATSGAPRPATLSSAGTVPAAPTVPETSPSSSTGNPLSSAPSELSALEATATTIKLTGYSFQDNNPPGSATVSCPQIRSHHGKAGGTGTYDDPLTVASDGKNGGAGQFGVKCGSRFYVVNLQRYVVVEDTGNTADKQGIHLDTWVADDPTKTCMDKITGPSKAIPNPPPGLPVIAGPIGSNSRCLLPDGSGSGSGGSS